jgi:hypothetical protein
MTDVIRRRSAELYYCILLYRRFVICSALELAVSLANVIDLQNKILRYSRLKICATPSVDRSDQSSMIDHQSLSVLLVIKTTYD